jgi:Phosphotransferase enzyme family
MIQQNLHPVLKAFGLNLDLFTSSHFGSGHINHTFLLSHNSNDEKYILQEINTHVFPKPSIIAQNLAECSGYLAKKYPDYLFINSLKTNQGATLHEEAGHFWRLSPYISNSYSFNRLDSPQLAFEAAKAFGLLTHRLADMPIGNLQPSIVGFHDLTWRYQQFEVALAHAKNQRKSEALAEIEFAYSHRFIVDEYESIVNHPHYPTRMVHHDTKINNVLFDQTTQLCLCVCDLDTLMPGRIISDVGDMIRTYTCSQSEESADFEAIQVRNDYFEALIRGYLQPLKDSLTALEIESLFSAGLIMVYMQGLRFLTDYLSNDAYYPIQYANQNLNRAKNQQYLLRDLLKKEGELKSLIGQVCQA